MEANEITLLDTGDIKAAWAYGDTIGDGYVVGEAADEIDAHAEELDLPLIESLSDHDTAVYSDGETMVAVSDSHGPWAVDIDISTLRSAVEA